MPSRDLYEAVAALTYPLPDREASARLNPHLPEEEVDLILDDLRNEALDDRARLAEALRDRLVEEEGEFDPLISQISHWRGEQLRAERMVRLLIAYGREFVRPQPYPLKGLAAAAGLSISGTRIAYDDDEVRYVEKATGDRPRRPWPADESTEEG